jgi:hypothetical protein
MLRSHTTPEGTPRQFLAFAAVFAAVGAQLIWASYTHHPSLRVPPAVGYVVAAVLFASSAAAVAKASGRPRLVEGLVALMLLGMAVTGGWIALGSNGACATSLPLRGAARIAGCRAGFGTGAAITAAMAAWAAARWWRGGHRA